MSQKSRPVAVLISDIHYNINTLEVADKALRLAVYEANELEVPLIIAGDLHDTKANIRAECIKAIKETLYELSNSVVIIRGNHDSLNEKSKEHSLDFLSLGEYISIVNDISYLGSNLLAVPYQHDPGFLKNYIDKTRLQLTMDGPLVIMHQGVKESYSGDYIQDKSAITKQDLAGLRVISGHYHRRQQFELPNGGLFDYIGNPYTLNFAEANDPEKGFQILHEDGSLTFVPTNLRRHKIIDLTANIKYNIKDDDILWVKATGSSAELSKITKLGIAEKLKIKQDFRLELIPNDLERTSLVESVDQTQDQLLDNIIDSLNVSDDKKAKLKSDWKSFT